MAIKQKTYEGYGMMKLLDVCWEHHLTKQNSDLVVDDYDNPNSHWIVRVKPGYITTTK